MATDAPPSPPPLPFDAQTIADAEAVIAHVMHGTPLDPEIRRRLHAESDRVREEIFATHGLVDIAIPAIRDLRENPRGRTNE